MTDKLDIAQVRTYLVGLQAASPKPWARSIRPRS